MRPNGGRQALRPYIPAPRCAIMERHGSVAPALHARRASGGDDGRRNPDPRGRTRDADAQAGRERDPQGDRGPGLPRRPPAGGAPDPRPHADRGRARPRQDAGREDPGADPGDRLPAHPVHPGPAARRPRGDADLRPEDGRVHAAPGPDLQPRRADRRDQPRARQGAVGAARVDGGEAGDPGGHHLSPARALHGAGDPEPDRAGGHLPAGRGPGRPLHDEAQAHLPEPPRRGGDPRSHAGREPADRDPPDPRPRAPPRAAPGHRPGLPRRQDEALHPRPGDRNPRPVTGLCGASRSAVSAGSMPP